MFFKTIIQGSIKFGNERSYDKVLKMYNYRAENYHKLNVIFKESDEIFFRDDFELIIKRYVAQTTEKAFKNTVSLLDYCSQFGVSGKISAWLIDDGKILGHSDIEPNSDKAVVQQFLKGRKLIKEKGKESEAYEALSKVIEKYDSHAQAYEKRGRVNFVLKKYHDAIRDYTKCIQRDDSIPQAYYGRGLVHIHNKDYDLAIKDLEMATKKAVALQSIYWMARRLKSDCHIKLEQWHQAEFDLKLFTKRKFEESNPNILWKKQAYFNYGLVLTKLEKYPEAIEAFDSALEQEQGKSKVANAEIIVNRGLAKQKSGKSGYIKDIKEAADLGDKSAKKLLKDLV